MQPSFKRISKLAAGYSIITLGTPLLTALLIPLYTRVLDPAVYGITDVVFTFGNFFVLIATCAIDQVLGLFYFEGDQYHQRRLVNTALICVLSIGSMVGVFIILSADFLATLFFQDSSQQSLFYLIAFNVATVPVYTVSTSALRLRMQVKQANILGLSYILCSVISNILLVVVLRLNAVGVVAATSLSFLIASFVSIKLTGCQLTRDFHRALVLPLMRAGVVLLPGMVAYTIFMTSDRLVLTQFVSQSDIGLYAIANKIGATVAALLGVVWLAWWPMAIEIGNQPDAPRYYARAAEYFLALSTLISLTLGLYTPEILAVFTRPAYAPAATYTVVLLFYYGPLQVMNNCFMTAVYVKKRVSWISAALIVMAVTNLGLNFFLVPRLGVWGAVIATIGSAPTYAILMVFLGRNIMPVEYRWKQMGFLAGVYIIIVALGLWTPLLASFIVRAGMVLLVALIVFAIGIITPSQLLAGATAVNSQLYSWGWLGRHHRRQDYPG